MRLCRQGQPCALVMAASSWQGHHLLLQLESCPSEAAFLPLCGQIGCCKSSQWDSSALGRSVSRPWATSPLLPDSLVSFLLADLGTSVREFFPFLPRQPTPLHLLSQKATLIHSHPILDVLFLAEIVLFSSIQGPFYYFSAWVHIFPATLVFLLSFH